MRKTLVVAMREYQAAVKTKAFIISLVALPLFYTVMFVVQFALRDKVDTTDRRVVVVDESGVLFDAIADAAAKYNKEEVYKEDAGERKKVKPQFLIERVASPNNAPEQRALELSDKVRAQGLFAFVMIDRDVLQTDDPPQNHVRYYSNTPTYEDLPDWLAGVVNREVKSLRYTAAGLDVDAINKASSRVGVANLGLVSRDEAGNIKEAEQTNRIANFLIPLGTMMLMFIVVMVGASPLMQSVLEEKMQRIAEVLLGSVSPFELMLGKLLGMVGVSATIATVYLVGGYFALRGSGYGQFFPAHIVWWFVLYLVLAVLMYGALFVAIGAAVTDIKEAQSLMTPVMLIVCGPMLVWANVIKEPNATFALVSSLIPPATPMLMLIRQTVPPGIPLWQPILGVILVTLTTLFLVFAAGRIFRVGILMQGRGAKFGEMLRWVLRG